MPRELPSSPLLICEEQKREERVIVLDPTLSFDSCVLEEEKDKGIKKCSCGGSGLLLH